MTSLYHPIIATSNNNNICENSTSFENVSNVKVFMLFMFILILIFQEWFEKKKQASLGLEWHMGGL